MNLEMVMMVMVRRKRRRREKKNGIMIISRGNCVVGFLRGLWLN
jgi:hypothetical protein